MSGRPLIVFCISCGFLLYVMVGYPLLLKLLAKFRRRVVRKDDFLPTVAMVIPVRNAENYLDRKLDSVLAMDYPKDLLEVLVVSDGSTDDTDAIAKSYAAWDVKLLHVPRGGKAAALNAGVPTTRAEIVVLSEVWQILEPGSVRAMVRDFCDPAVGVVSGEVVMDARNGGAEERNLSMFARLEGWFGEQLSHVDSLLGSSGPFYAIRRKLMPRIPGDSLLDDLYVSMAVFFRGYRVVVEPDATAFDNAVPVETQLPEKIMTQAGDYQIMRQYPGLLTARNRMRFHYSSYKLARLLMPIALIAIAVTSFQLSSRRMMMWALGTQFVIYGLAVVYPWLGEGFFLKRMAAAVRTFVLTMIASLCAAVVLVVPVRKLWKNLETD